GVDFTAAYRPPQVEGLGLFLNGQWNRARFKRLNNIPCWGGQTVAEGCTEQPDARTGLFTAQNLNGIPLARAPTWQLAFGFDYEMPLSDGRTIVVSNNNAYYSRYLLILGKRPDFYQPSFFKSDLSVALRGPNDHWE